MVAVLFPMYKVIASPSNGPQTWHHRLFTLELLWSMSCIFSSVDINGFGVTVYTCLPRLPLMTEKYDTLAQKPLP